MKRPNYGIQVMNKMLTHYEPIGIQAVTRVPPINSQAPSADPSGHSVFSSSEPKMPSSPKIPAEPRCVLRFPRKPS